MVFKMMPSNKHPVNMLIKSQTRQSDCITTFFKRIFTKIHK